MNIDTGEIRSLDKLKPEELDTGKWEELPTAITNRLLLMPAEQRPAWLKAYKKRLKRGKRTGMGRPKSR